MLLLTLGHLPNILNTKKRPQSSHETPRQLELLVSFEKIKTQFLDARKEIETQAKGLENKLVNLLEHYNLYEHGDNFSGSISRMDVESEKMGENIIIKEGSDLQEKLKTLFFSDFLSLYIEFLFYIDRLAKDLKRKGNCFNDNTLMTLMYDMEQNKEFLSKKENINFCFLEAEQTDGYNFLYFYKKLEGLVNEKIGWSSKELRSSLFLSFSDVSFDTTKDENILMFFEVLRSYFCHSYPKHENRLGWIVTRLKIGEHNFHDPHDIDCSSIIKNYTKYLKIDIIASYNLYKEQRWEEEDGRYRSYIENKEVFGACCHKKNNNLLSVSCDGDKHDDMLSKIKQDFFLNLPHKLRNGHDSGFNEVVSAEISNIVVYQKEKNEFKFSFY
ncbi:hypothetical protein CDIK_3091 [Cucumispora dikerogammari]|nr:hypothetical protein CDIK_3091 [Cucumispora dikerogammari]